MRRILGFWLVWAALTVGRTDISNWLLDTAARDPKISDGAIALYFRRIVARLGADRAEKVFREVYPQATDLTKMGAALNTLRLVKTLTQCHRDAIELIRDNFEHFYGDLDQ